jgi:polar amino acid transport system substrate-binding protein
MKKRAIAIILAAVLLVSFVFVLAGCEKKPERTLVLGLDDAFPPMGYRDDKGNLVGFDIDLAKEVCKRLNYELKLQPIDWKLKQQELDSKNVDCLWNGYTITDERLAQNSITQAYMKNRQILVVKADSSIASLDDMAGKKLALQSGSSAQDALDPSAEFKAKLGSVLQFDTNNKALMDLIAGGCDAVLMDEVVALHYVKTEAKCKTLNVSLADEEYGVGFRKADTALRDAVQKTLKEMAADGTLAKISKEWFGKDVTIIK